MSLFHGRSRRNDPRLEWKVALFTVAAVIGLAGMYFDERWMGGVAIALLASAMLLRLLPGGESAELAGSDDSETASEGGRSDGGDGRG